MPEDTPNPHAYCPFSDPPFQRAVIEGLAVLKTQAEQTNDHLDRLNGSVARHEQQLNDLRIWKATQDAGKATNRKWMKPLASAAYAMLGALGGALLRKFF